MSKKKKNTLRGMLATVMVIGIFIGGFPTVKAAGTTESITVTKDAIEFVDENGEVMAVFTPYSETNPAPGGLTKSTSVSVNCSVEGKHQGYLSNQYNLNDGDRIDTNITISPQVSSNIGLYNRDTGTFGFPVGGLSSYGWFGYLTVSGNGKYSLAFQNNSDTTANYSGSYTLP